MEMNKDEMVLDDISSDYHDENEAQDYENVDIHVPNENNSERKSKSNQSQSKKQTKTSKMSNTQLNPEDKQKSEEALVKYLLKNFPESKIYDVSFTIQAHDVKIFRRIYLGDEMDVNILSHIIFELFEFTSNSYRIEFANFTLTGSPGDNILHFQTKNVLKDYPIELVYLRKLKIKPNETFKFIHDVYEEKWEIKCKVESCISTKEIIKKKYKTQKERDLAFVKLKSFIRPVLIDGDNQSPPEGMGGPEEFTKFLKHRNNMSDPYTLKYIKYYKSLSRHVNDESPDVIFNFSKYIEDLDVEGIQAGLSKINLLTFYEERKKATPENKVELNQEYTLNEQNSNENCSVKSKSDINFSNASRDIVYYGGGENNHIHLEEESEDSIKVEIDKAMESFHSGEVLRDSDLLMQTSDANARK